MYDTYIDTTSWTGWVFVHLADGRIVEMDAPGGWHAHERDVDLKIAHTGSGVASIWVVTTPASAPRARRRATPTTTTATWRRSPIPWPTSPASPSTR